MPGKVSVSLACVSTCMRLASSLPSAPSRPSPTGITNGSLSAWPGVAGQLCSSVSRYSPVAASYCEVAVTRGVPAWLYQRLNCGSSCSNCEPGLASAIACAKSSQVTAWPSWRWKYSVMPLAKPSRPTRVCIMRTTSAPFSYTVTV